MGPGPKRVLGSNGPWPKWVQIGPAPKRALGPSAAWAQTGPGPNGLNLALGPNGPWAQMGPGPKWAEAGAESLLGPSLVLAQPGSAQACPGLSPDPRPRASKNHFWMDRSIVSLGANFPEALPQTMKVPASGPWTHGSQGSWAHGPKGAWAQGPKGSWPKCREHHDGLRLASPCTCMPSKPKLQQYGIESSHF